MKKALWIILSVLLISVNSFSLVLPLSVRVKAGAAHIPMTDWQSFAGNTNLPTDKYTTLTPTLFGGLSIHWRISEKHSINLGSELLKPKSQWVGAMIQTIYNENLQKLDTLGLLPFRIDWTFQAVPLTLGYEFDTGILKDRFEPVIGFGVSLIFSEIKVTDIFMSDIHTIITNSGSKRKGKGYGIEGLLGFHTKINNHFRSIWQVRYRYSDGMYFTDHPGDIKVKFSGFDFSVGLEYGL